MSIYYPILSLLNYHSRFSDLLITNFLFLIWYMNSWSLFTLFQLPSTHAFWILTIHHFYTTTGCKGRHPCAILWAWLLLRSYAVISVTCSSWSHQQVCTSVYYVCACMGVFSHYKHLTAGLKRVSLYYHTSLSKILHCEFYSVKCTCTRIW